LVGSKDFEQTVQHLLALAGGNTSRLKILEGPTGRDNWPVFRPPLAFSEIDRSDANQMVTIGPSLMR
jgi:hypothetical protein